MPIPSRSIRRRLLLMALLSISAAMAAAGWTLAALFEHHVERRVVAALEADLRQLISGLAVGSDGTISLQRRPTDPRFDQPLSGTYWQVTSGGAVVDRSRSLWDEVLRLSQDNPAGGMHEHTVVGPQARPLVVVERVVEVATGQKPVTVRFAVAQDRAETIAAVGTFSREIALMLVVLGAILLIAFGTAVSVGLMPFGRLRDDLADLRSGTSRRLAGPYPAEVALLVDDLNKLMDARDAVAERKRHRAADLAHGLKTPITAISAIADEVASSGQPAIAEELRAYTGTMLRHVERELALSRSSHVGPAAAPTQVKPLFTAIVRSLERLPRGADLAWDIDVSAGSALRIEPTALAEILGGLLDNARKWARSRVSVRDRVENGHAHIVIADDGPGVAEDKLASLTARGLRLDEKKAGSGLGLSIAAEIVDELGGTITFTNAPTGGLIAEVRLPQG